MSSFIAAYVVVWCGLAAFVVRLSLAQRQLARALAAVQEQLQERNPNLPAAADRRAA